MNISELKGGKYLRKEDLESPALLTIKDVVKQNVAPPNEPPEIKGVMSFVEPDISPLVLNSTNANRVASLYGMETDDWRGQKIVAFNDPNVEYAGKMIGGVRLRAPKGVKPIMEEEEPPF